MKKIIASLVAVALASSLAFADDIKINLLFILDIIYLNMVINIYFQYRTN